MDKSGGILKSGRKCFSWCLGLFNGKLVCSGVLICCGTDSILLFLCHSKVPLHITDNFPTRH